MGGKASARVPAAADVRQHAPFRALEKEARLGGPKGNDTRGLKSRDFLLWEWLHSDVLRGKKWGEEEKDLGMKGQWNRCFRF